MDSSDTFANFFESFGGGAAGKKVNLAHENVGRKFMDDKGVIHISTGQVEGDFHRCYCIHDPEKREVNKLAKHWFYRDVAK